MYELNGKEYSLARLQEEASFYQMEFDDYMSAMTDKGLKKKEQEAPSVYRNDVEITWDQAVNDKELYRSLSRQEKRNLAKNSNTEALSTNPLIQLKTDVKEWLGFDTKNIYQMIDSGIARANAFDETSSVFYGGGDLTDKQYQDYVDVTKTMQSRQDIDAYNRWDASFDKHKEAGENNAMATLLAIKEEGTGGLLGVMVQSMTGLLNKEIIAAGGVTAVGGGIVGGPVGGVAGFFTGANAAAETMITFSGHLQEELERRGQDFTAENVRRLMQDEEAVKKLRNVSLKRGVTIGAIEGITSLIGMKGAGKVFDVATDVVGRSVAGRLTATGAAGATAGISEMAGGMLGETAGLIIEGKPLDAKQIIVEGIAGLGGAPVSVSVGIGKTLLNQPKYTVNGTDISFETMKDIVETATPEEIAGMDIQIKNDKTLGQQAFDKQNRVLIGAQIDPNISEQSDIDAVIDYEIEIQKLKGKNTKSAQNRIKALEVQIEEIQNKYTGIGPEVDPKGVETRVKTAEKIKEARRKVLKDKILKKVVETKAYKEMDITTEDMTSEQALDAFIENETNNALLDISLLEEEQANAKTAKEKRDITKELREVEKRYNDLQTGELAKEVKDSHGFLLEDYATGKMKIVINENMAISENGNINVAAHEFLHAVLKKTFETDTGYTARQLKGVGVQTGQKLLDYLVKNEEATLLFDGQIINRLKSYAEGDIKGQEVLNLLADALVNTNYKPKSEGVLKSIGAFLSNHFESLLPVKYKNQLDFTDGKQVFDFIKTFRKSIEGDEKAQAEVARVAKEGIDIKAEEEVKPEQTKPPMSKTVDNKPMVDDLGQMGWTNETWKTQGAKMAQEEIVENGYFDQLIAAQLKVPRSPEETNKFVKKVYSELTQHIKNFRPQDNDSLFGWINPQIKNKATAVYNREKTPDVLKKAKRVEDKTKEGEPVIQVAAEEVTTEFDETKPLTKSEKARILETFDVDLESVVGLDAVIMAEVEALVEQNPVNLEEKLDKIVTKQYAKIILDNMGKISKVKGETVVSEEYKAFHALSYDRMVASLDLNTIKKNYSKLFNIKKLKREKDKKVDPITGKVTYPGKGIYDVKIPSKAVWTKYFTEGGYTTLLERRRALAKIITASKAEIAVDNYIEANSKDINAVTKAKLRSMFNAEKRQTDEQKSFDRVTYLSKGAKQTLPASINTLFKKIKAKQIKNKTYVDDGRVLEQAFADHFRDLGITGLRVKAETASEKGGAADITFIYEGIEENHEIKKYLEGVFMGSTVFSSLNIETGKFTLANNVYNSLDTKGLMNKLLPKIKEKVDYINSRIVLYNEENNTNISPITGNIISGKPEIIPDEIYAEVHKDLAEIFQDESIIIDHYMNKTFTFKVDGKKITVKAPVKSMTIGNLGTVRLSDESIFPNAPMLKAKSRARAALYTSGHTMKDGVKMRAFKVRIQLDIVEGLKSKNLVDITTKEGFDAAVGKPRFSEAVTNYPPGLVNMSTAISNTRSTQAYFSKPRGMSTFDFDETLIIEGKNFITATDPSTGEKIKISSENWPLEGPRYAEQGFEFDFTDFVNVRGGVEGPLLQKMKNQIKKFGPENVFVLTARPPQSATAIHEWLKTKDINIPFENITGLGNSTGEAKAVWMLEKFAEGYNDMYFVDDALPNVEAVKHALDQLDIKSNVQQVKLIEKHGRFLVDVSTKEGREMVERWKKIPTIRSSDPSRVTKFSKSPKKVQLGKVPYMNVDVSTKEGRDILERYKKIPTISSSDPSRITKFSKGYNVEFNNILEDVAGIDAKKRFSAAKARKRGEGKGRFRFFIPPSHEDFIGLLYNFMGKGTKGNQHRNFFEQALIKPLNRAYTELNAAKQAISNDYRNLIKKFPDTRKKLTKKTPDGDYTYGDAIRVYLWDKSGFDIPGMSKTDIKELTDLISKNPDLKTFADAVVLISRQKEGYVKPGQEWEVGDVRTDLADATLGVGRKQFFTEFIENSEIIFSKENLNKIEAIHGKNFREALEEMLYKIKNGRPKPTGKNRLVNRFVEWINGSVGSTMFINPRSAILQQLSVVNFLNFSDNNIFTAAISFADQKQYWKDYAMIFNSDFLKQRRAGIAFDVNGAELAQAVSKSKEPARAAIRYLLQKGFILTQLGDSNAIAMGGATFYRNRVNTYLKQGLSKKEAESKAWTDFTEIAEMTQQSARPDMISQQQSSVLGKFILAFQNVTSQYNRFGIKKPTLDLINRRKTPPYDTQWQSDMSNISRIIYYGAIQNFIFYGLQTALFAMMFDDEERDKEFFEKKRDRIINGSIDSILRGMGVGGAIISTIKNAAMKIAANQKKKWSPATDVLVSELLQLSPPVGIKARKLSGAEKTYKYNKKVIKEMETFDFDNPIWDATSNVIEGTTNLPTNRIHRLTTNTKEALDSRNAWWQRLALLLGWNKWELGVENEEIEAVKKEIKENNKKIKKKSQKKKGKSFKKKFKTF